ncbi:hypothetical protein A6A04_20615 [Paramagnetospirillum marisnigri]|uniref:RNA-binding protein AU-1/Ribonuclease E/G domain-containing protein n=1 Tax=Paramagnetospirillum marisnigri TaxID=1285242 RepID=A0A178MCL1_9PROT|nr:ribonuclease E/G [Paramagnetospirillum marisnigri]OAN46499.1 hypothetical protein A6A04_20615 [Paramagnetospirillum marisnigri]
MAAADGILWCWGPGDSRFGLTVAGQVVELFVHRPTELAGCVFRGRVIRVEAALDAAFVDLGAGDRPGFLGGAKALGLSEGMTVAVRVKTESAGAKGPKLVPAPEFPFQGPVPALLERPHPLALLLARHPGIAELRVSDPAALAEARALFPAARLERGLSLDEELEAALAPVVPLACGGRLVMEPTAALTAVDVDSGPAKPAEANRQAVAEIARQLRLRGIGGQVVVDFVSGPKGTPYKLAEALKRVVATDPTPTHVFGVSKLGLVEVVRERLRPSLAEVMCRRASEPTAETLALAGLRRLLAEAEARPGARLGLVAAPEVVAALSRLPDAMAEVERRLGRGVGIRADACRTRDDVLIEDLR